MAKKRKVVVKKPAKPAAATMRAKRAKPAKSKPQSPPSGGSWGNLRQPKFATFERAKNAAIDTLIEAIEEAEQRLSAAKRARSFEDLSKLTASGTTTTDV
jgi:hypothetical protein